jgi:uncharacterized membrane protein
MSKLERYFIGGIIALMVLAVAAIILGRWLVKPTAPPEEPLSPNAPQIESETMTARVVDILEEGVKEPGGYPYQRVLLYVEDGSLGGQEIEIEEGTVNIISSERLFDVGDRVLLLRDETCVAQAGQETCYEHIYIADFVRTTPLLWIVAFFVGLVLLVGRGRGLRSLAGTLLSLLVIFFFILPMIKAKYDPVMVSVLGASILLLASTYVVYGWNYKAHAAVLGMILSLVMTWGLAALFVSWTHLTGMGQPEEASYLALELGTDLSFRGLVLAGIIIGALGVLDDVCVGQASAVFELVNANRDLGWVDLFRSSLNIGRDHIAAMVNTLLLAYVGASLPLMLVFTIYTEPLWYRINREPITEEIVRTLVGSLGLMLAVPITGLIASLIARWAVRQEEGRAVSNEPVADDVVIVKAEE